MSSSHSSTWSTSSGAVREKNDTQAVVLLGVIDDRALEFLGVDVAHDADREVGLLEDERRGAALRDSLLEHLVQLEQIQELALEIGALGALSGGADDRAGALQIELRRLLAEAVALLVIEPARDADAFAVRREDHVPAGDRQIHREARALGLERILDHLDDDFLAWLEHVADLPGLASGAAAPAWSLDPGQDDLVDVQEPVLLQADVDERGFQPGEDVVHAALVDVAHDRAGSASLDVELGDLVPRSRGGCLTAPASGSRAGLSLRRRFPSPPLARRGSPPDRRLLKLASSIDLVLCELIARRLEGAAGGRDGARRQPTGGASDTDGARRQPNGGASDTDEARRQPTGGAGDRH